MEVASARQWVNREKTRWQPLIKSQPTDQILAYDKTGVAFWMMDTEMTRRISDPVLYRIRWAAKRIAKKEIARRELETRSKWIPK